VSEREVSKTSRTKQRREIPQNTKQSEDPKIPDRKTSERPRAHNKENRVTQTQKLTIRCHA
jgi:hypothetical protein